MPFDTYTANPADLSLMHRVLRRLCAERNLVPANADDLALAVMSAFKAGYRDEASLVRALSEGQPNSAGKGTPAALFNEAASTG